MEVFKVFKFYKAIIFLIALGGMQPAQGSYGYYRAAELTDNLEVDLLETVIDIYMQKGTMPLPAETSRPEAKRLKETNPSLYKKCFRVISKVLGKAEAQKTTLYFIPSKNFDWKPEEGTIPAFANKNSIYFTEHFLKNDDAGVLHVLAHEAAHIKYEHSKRKNIAINLLANIQMEVANPSVHKALTEKERRLLVALFFEKETTGLKLLEEQALMHEKQADLTAYTILSKIKSPLPKKHYTDNGKMHPSREALFKKSWHTAYSLEQYSHIV
jgi:hypothetical protein